MTETTVTVTDTHQKSRGFSNVKKLSSLDFSTNLDRYDQHAEQLASRTKSPSCADSNQLVGILVSSIYRRNVNSQEPKFCEPKPSHVALSTAAYWKTQRPCLLFLAIDARAT